MRNLVHLQIAAAFALLCGASVAAADVPGARPATETVVIIGNVGNCDEASPERARSLADKAWRDGAYQRAGECYLAAGEHGLADQAYVKASVQTSPDTSRRLASNLNDVKAQARQMKEAFRRR